MSNNLLEIIIEQIKILQELQESFKNSNDQKIILISQQINELSKTYLEIKKSTITKC